MNRKAILLAPTLALGLMTVGGAPALAHGEEGDAGSAETRSYSAALGQINNSGASGDAWIDVTGSEATVTINTAGLAETFNDNPYPHVQHIHIGAQGQCPGPETDSDGDGIISTVEGQPAYGMIGTTLSLEGSTGPEAGTDISVAPTGGSYTYQRTFELNQETQNALTDGTGVVVVHGLDPATQPAAATEKMSNLPGAEALPLAATAPALCGALNAMPMGGADTGATVAKSSNPAEWSAIGLGGAGLLTAITGGWALRRRTSHG